MANFTVPVVRVRQIEPIPGADVIEVALVGDYRSVTKKGQFAQDDLAIYVPEGAIVPDGLLEQIGLLGRLSGSGKNRVKAIRLRGVVSQGLLLDPHEFPDLCLAEDTDCAEALGIVKWTPEIPQCLRLAGNVQPFDDDRLKLHYDLENIKKFRDVFVPGEPVVMTEKLHGTQLACVLTHDRYFVTSKGIMGKGAYLKPDDPQNAGNFYIGIVESSDLPVKVGRYFGLTPDRDNVVHVFGEGLGVQDLKYGTGTDRSVGNFRVFDVAVNRRFLNDDELEDFCEKTGIPRVPVLYRGPFSRIALDVATNGKETLTGAALHIREGTVVKPLVERTHPRLGRVILKSVSDDYLLRKGETTEID
jgi:RNA ligase (TIGR02306 family)